MKTAKTHTPRTATLHGARRAAHPKSPTPDNPHGWLRRYWLVIVVLIVGGFLALDETLYKTLGTLIYVPVLGALVIACALFTRRVLNQHTSDADSSDGTFNEAWANLDDKTRCTLQVVERVAYLIVFALVVLAVMR